MNHQEEKIYSIALGLIPGVGNILAKQLISYCGGAENVFKQKKSHLLKVPGIGEPIVKALKGDDISTILNKAEEEFKFCEKNNNQIICYHEANFPKRLHHCKDAPYLIYQKGTADVNTSKIVNIVGTRKATPYGKAITEKIVADLAAYDVTIVSGLAYGIDAEAHRKALEYNLPTIGVLAHGLDQIYPHLHRKLAHQMIEANGALITEFKRATKPDKQNFPSRNRIVAGMSDATIVIESASKGGSLITADIAHSYNRDVFAVPGRINDPLSEGCNNLIKYNIAALIHSGEDVIQMLGWNLDKKSEKSRPKQRSLFIELDEKEQKIVDVLEEIRNPLHVDDLKQKINLPSSAISMALLSLELKGVVHSRPGSCYVIV